MKMGILSSFLHFCTFPLIRIYTFYPFPLLLIYLHLLLISSPPPHLEQVKMGRSIGDASCDPLSSPSETDSAIAPRHDSRQLGFANFFVNKN